MTAVSRRRAEGGVTQLIVMAKAPVPGRVKTRLCPPYTPAQAARLAAAALADTLAAGDAAPVAARIVAVHGPYAAPAGWQALRQRGRGLGSRLANAYRDTARPGVATLLIGMDTPQVTPDLLRQAVSALAAPGVDAVLGPAEDGGWWALGLNDPVHARVLAQVPMSTPRTGVETAGALSARGLRVAPLPVLRDVDTAEDARAVVRQCRPQSRFFQAMAAG